MNNNKVGDSLQSGSFLGLLVLQTLLLNNNGITKPPAESIAGLSTLQYLRLQENNITELQKSAFGRLPVLFELNLYKNGIKDINKHAFEGLLQLLTLNLSHNSIINIPNDAFVGLPSLRRLDLSHNYLTKLDNKTNGVLDDLLSLEYLNLSNNKISFVTKKTFPSNIYIPYNLKYLDLSYNQMPVLTYDITFGTKKLLEFNISHNHINELRKGVLANFTELQSIDLSYNKLTNLMSEPNIFNIPKNLSKIYLQNNEIYRLPFEKFIKEPRMEEINLKSNQLTEFPSTLVRLLKNNTRVLFDDNPLECTCAARPLLHFYLQNTSWSEDLSNIFCESPVSLKTQQLISIADKHLICSPKIRETYNGTDYDELMDVNFRDIEIDNNGILTVKWFVTSPGDIADFLLYLRDDQNVILYEDNLEYNKRIAKVPLSLALIQNSNTNVDICIVSKDSNNKVGRWFNGQCQSVSELLGVRKLTYKVVPSCSAKQKLNLICYFLSLFFLFILL
ncbi:chondroadherin-like protein [Teleopsis dalmanni]|uniref:chondroadherin-like protein n=1 Tax=Teleopsis dalmanni TaxID=139649 RepID=UPI0018CD319E|nr:chondroadherin-like protein [Teleopsis dalmanni]